MSACPPIATELPPRKRAPVATTKNILVGKRGNVVTIEPTADLAAAVKLLAERRIGAVVILGADDRIVGILSERDFVPWCFLDAVPSSGRLASQSPASKNLHISGQQHSQNDNLRR